MIRNIIWDLDGTLFDTYPAISSAFQTALADLGKAAPLEWIDSLAKKSVGMCETTLAEHYQLSADELDQKFIQRYDHARPEDQPPFPGATELCKYISSTGGKNVIVTHRRQVGTVELAVGDRDIDILVGQAAGVLTCLFGPKIQGLSSDLTVGNLDELHKYILEVNSVN